MKIIQAIFGEDENPIKMDGRFFFYWCFLFLFLSLLFLLLLLHLLYFSQCLSLSFYYFSAVVDSSSSSPPPSLSLSFLLSLFLSCCFFFRLRKCWLVIDEKKRGQESLGTSVSVEMFTRQQFLDFLVLFSQLFPTFQK